PGAAEGAVQGDVEDPAPLVVGHLDEVGGATESGVVDEDVEPAVAFLGEVEQRGDLFLVGDVAGQPGDAVGAELPGQGRGALLDPAGVGVAEDDAGALLKEAARGGAADAGSGGGGDDGGPPGEQVMTGDVGRRLGGRGVHVRASL